MKFRSIFWYFYLISFNVCDFKILMTSEVRDLTTKTKELVEMCFANDSNLVMTIPKLADAFQDSDKVSTIIIESEIAREKQIILPGHPIIVVPYESTEQLEDFLVFFQGPNRWSTRSPFLLIETASNCANANLLGSLWKRDFLSAFYLCNYDNSTIIKTLNPFTAYAPHPWVQSAEKFVGADEKEWTIFSLEHSKDPEICSALTYDKTHFLNGTVIRFVHSYGPQQEDTETQLQDYVKEQLNDQQANVYQIAQEIGGEPTIPISPSDIDILDLAISIELTSGYKAQEPMPEHFPTEYSILTKKSSFLSSRKVITVNIRLIVLTGIALVLISVLMVLTRDQFVDGPFLNLVRLIFGIGMEAEFNRLSMKIIFVIGFVFSFFLTSDFLGEVQASLATPPRRNAETLQDLFDDKFKVYYFGKFNIEIEDSGLWDVNTAGGTYLFPIRRSKQMEKCLIRARSDPKIACIHETLKLLEFAKEHDDVYVSEKPVFNVLEVQMVKKNWALKDKFNKKLTAAYESGQFSRVDKQKQQYIKKNMKKIERMEMIEAEGRINSEYFDYFFGFMMVVMIFAVAVFMLERFARNFARVRNFYG